MIEAKRRFLADDLGKTDITVYGVPFTDAYYPAPICGPSRAGMLAERIAALDDAVGRILQALREEHDSWSGSLPAPLRPPVMDYRFTLDGEEFWVRI